jgi:hypothetical protein
VGRPTARLQEEVCVRLRAADAERFAFRIQEVNHMTFAFSRSGLRYNENAIVPSAQTKHRGELRRDVPFEVISLGKWPNHSASGQLGLFFPKKMCWCGSFQDVSAIIHLEGQATDVV